MGMKSYKIIRKNMKVYAEIISIIQAHNKYKNSYFWNPPGNASSRRYMEFEHTLEFSLNGDVYEVIQQLDCSCRNVYYSLRIYLNDTKKDIRLLKKLVNYEAYVHHQIRRAKGGE